MRKGRFQARLAPVALLSLCVAVGQPLFNADAFTIAVNPLVRPAQGTERIQRVENGLLYPAAIKGAPSIGMKLAERMRFYGVPGVSIAVVNDFALEWSRAYGTKEAGSSEPVTTETLFQAASISKPIVAVSALRLVEQGKLGLDESVNRKLTSWKIPDNEFTQGQSVTLRHLLSHTGGLTNHAVGTYSFDEKVPTLLEALDGLQPAKPRPVRVDFVPGSRWRYSGGGYSVLQQLLVDVAGKAFPTLMQETVLQPLGMMHSFYQQPLSKDLAPFAAAGHRFTGDVVKGKWMILPEMAAGGLWSTPSDLARFVIELLQSGAGRSNTNRVLSAGMAKQMLTSQTATMGLGISVTGKAPSTLFSHGGANPGYRCFMAGYADSGKGAVVMTNSDNGDSLAREIIRSIAREYGWLDYRPEIREVVKVDPEVFEAYIGRYEYARGRTIAITAENGRFFAQDNREFKSEIFPESPTAYFSILYNTAFRFVRDETGQVTAMFVRWAGDSEDTKSSKIK